MADASSAPGQRRGRFLWLELRSAFSFLTVFPIPAPSAAQIEADAALFGRAFGWYPLVGLAVGAILFGAQWTLAQLPFSSQIQAALLLGLWIVISGGLHLDGLMDSCDALFAPVGVERRLQILKDVHTGAFGVIGVVWVLLLKWSLLAQIVESGPPTAMILAPVWGRWMLVWASERFPYARAEASLGSFIRQGLGPRQTVIASALALSVHGGFGVAHPTLLWLLIALPMGVWLARWGAARLGGGLTGDLYGALCECVEVLILLAAVML